MKPLFNISNLDTFSSNKKLPLECECCGKIFFSIKKEIRKVLNGHKAVKLKFCSKECRSNSRFTKKTLFCGTCNTPVDVVIHQIKKSKSGKNFCSRSCATTYNNKHKTNGFNRSKLEIWLEKKLKETHSDVTILFNDNKIIGYELDIYIPSLKLAFEINGIYHYKPIFGDKKFMMVKKVDRKKYSKCKKMNIRLYRINISKQKHFNEQNSLKYLEKIESIINKNR